MSAGTAAVLGLAKAPLLVAPTTAYLMVGERCAMDCAFCAQARSSQADDILLSRVIWPRFPVASVVEALSKGLGDVRRVCLQVTAGGRSFDDALELVHLLTRRTLLPVDASVLPPTHGAVGELFEAGLDHLGFGVDAATRPTFIRVKGAGWERYQGLIECAAADHPGKVAVHLIAGLGESEREMILAIQRYHDLGAVVGLFAFYPVPGTRMAGMSPPALGSYRRLQIARYLITQGFARASDMEFDEAGRLVDCAQPVELCQLAVGTAFETSGCPDCNRPFYNERPSGPLYNYPRPLRPEELDRALADTGLPRLVRLREGTQGA